MKPNIITIVTHDTGRHFGCYGVPTVDTPAIDALAADGIRFDSMYATSSICSPSRASLLTGLYPQSNGVVGLVHGVWHWELNDPTQHLSHVLLRNGYQTHLFGFQHEASAEKEHLLGFQQRMVPVDSNDCLQVAEATAEFLHNVNVTDQPFYAQVGFFETHTPYERYGCEPDETKGVWIPPYARDDETTRKHMAQLQGSIKKVDRAIETISTALREAGLEENTLVLFTVDHGFELPRGPEGDRAKWSMYDPGTGVGFVLRWPEGGLIGGQVCDWMLSNIDWMPTLCELIGIEPPHEMEGISFASWFTPEGPKNPSPRDEVHALFVNSARYGTRTERYKLIRNFAEGAAPFTLRVPQPVVELYDLSNDPLEQANVAAHPAYADVYKEMSERMWRWLEAVDAPILKGPVPTPTYNEAIAEYREWKEKTK